MDPEVKERWVAALESGEYKQGRCQLRSRDDKFCCLGVLVDVENPEMWRCVESYWTAGGRSGSLPRSIRADTGLHLGEAERLVAMNDRGATFQEIATYIRKNL